MSVYENSAGRKAAALRAAARGGLWRRFLTVLGLRGPDARTVREAGAWEAGSVGETRTAVLLAPLQRVGWAVLHDRAIPGARRANADHVVISPGARVFLVDSKLWSSKQPIHEVAGRLMHGQEDRGKAIDSLRFEAGLVERALQVPVQPVVAFHNAPVAGGGFFVGNIPVVPADALVRALVFNDGPRSAGALGLARRAEQVLPRYR